MRKSAATEEALFPLLSTERLDGVRDECGYDAYEMLQVRKFRVGVEGSFVEPFGMDGENGRFANGLEEVDAEAAGFAARRGDDPGEFVAELLLFARAGLEADKYVQRHSGVAW